MDINISIENIFEQLKNKIQNNYELQALLDNACEQVIYTINNKNLLFHGDLISQMETANFDENILK